MVLIFLNQARFLSDSHLKFEENLYLHYITESTYRFLPRFPVHYSFVTVSFDVVSFAIVFFKLLFTRNLE
jgi:hypothetical protein